MAIASNSASSGGVRPSYSLLISTNPQPAPAPNSKGLQAKYEELEYIVGKACSGLHWYFYTVVKENDDFANLVVKYLNDEGVSIHEVGSAYFKELHYRIMARTTPFPFTLSRNFLEVLDKIDACLLQKAGGRFVMEPYTRELG